MPLFPGIHRNLDTPGSASPDGLPGHISAKPAAIMSAQAGLVNPFLAQLGKARGLQRALTAEESKQIEFAFERLSGGGGTVTARQLKIGLRAMGFPAKNEDVHRLLAKKGLPNNAKIDQVVFTELLAGRLQEQEPHEVVQRSFQLFDLAGSGRITVDELAAIAQQLQCNISEEELRVRCRLGQLLLPGGRDARPLHASRHSAPAERACRSPPPQSRCPPCPPCPHPALAQLPPLPSLSAARPQLPSLGRQSPGSTGDARRGLQPRLRLLQPVPAPAITEPPHPALTRAPRMAAAGHD
jgi:centrin-1